MLDDPPKPGRPELNDCELAAAFAADPPKPPNGPPALNDCEPAAALLALPPNPPNGPPALLEERRRK